MKSKFKWVFVIVVVMMFVGVQTFVVDQVLAESESTGGTVVRTLDDANSGQLTPEAASWLYYFAVTPCRIYDSRGYNTIGNGGYWWPGRAEGIYIDLTDTYYQGGASSCPPPLAKSSYGEPEAVHIYIVSVPLSGQGNILAFPPQYAIPSTGSCLNYRTGVQNIGNAVSVQAYDSGTSSAIDLGILNRYGYTHIVIDVFGYYY